jgi:hypothetical protein
MNILIFIFGFSGEYIEINSSQRFLVEVRNFKNKYKLRVTKEVQMVMHYKLSDLPKKLVVNPQG